MGVKTKQIHSLVMVLQDDTLTQPFVAFISLVIHESLIDALQAIRLTVKLNHVIPMCYVNRKSKGDYQLIKS